MQHQPTLTLAQRAALRRQQQLAGAGDWLLLALLGLLMLAGCAASSSLGPDRPHQEHPAPVQSTTSFSTAPCSKIRCAA